MDTIQVVIELTPEEADKIRRPIHGQGGFQSLLQRIQNQLNEQERLILDIDDIRQIRRYQSRYGTGGFQGRLDAILAALRRLVRALTVP